MWHVFRVSVDRQLIVNTVTKKMGIARIGAIVELVHMICTRVVRGCVVFVH